MDNTTLILSQGFIAVLVGFLVEGLKRAGMASKYAMLVSALVGLILGLLASFLMPDVELGAGVFGGLLAGAAASGFYSGGKAALATQKSKHL